MGNTSSIKIAAVALAAVVNAHGPTSGPGGVMERCQAPIGRAVNVCKPWVSTTCPEAVEMKHMAECYLRNRSQAPKPCRDAGRVAWACAAKVDAAEECIDEFGARAGPCMKCEVASKEAELQCTETWFEVCSHVDVEDREAAKACFKKNRKDFPRRCQRAVGAVMKACQAEERMQEQHDRDMEARQEMREQKMEHMHREEEQKMEEMLETTRKHHREMEQKEMQHDRRMENEHEHMHPGMKAENHAEMEMHMMKERIHHAEDMQMETEMMKGVHQMEDMDRQAELLTTASMQREMGMHMRQEDMMHRKHAKMEAAPVDTRPISRMKDMPNF